MIYATHIQLCNSLVTDGPTDQPTNRPTDIVLHRAAIAAKNVSYKKKVGNILWDTL